MNAKLRSFLVGLAWLAGVNGAGAQGTVFSYQGWLSDNANAANGTYDLRFILYDADPGGSQQGPILTNLAVSVASGIFAVSLDFGVGVFTGGERWLEIAVRTNGVGGFTTLSPRQRVAATPYAITAGNLTGLVPALGLAGAYPGAVSFTNPANQLAGNGAGITNINAATLGGVGAGGFWKVAGNAGTTPGLHFIGTTDQQALEFKANGTRVLRIEPSTNDAPNIIAGSSLNRAAPGIVGATIAGGGAFDSGFSFNNAVGADFDVVGGGALNIIQAGAGSATIAGGVLNLIQTNANRATIGGGYFHTIQNDADAGTIAGGYQNTIQALAAYSTISGGQNNSVQLSADHAFIGGGSVNTNASSGAVIGGGINNVVQSNADYATIAGGNLNLISAASKYATIGGGQFNTIYSNVSAGTIAGGWVNFIETNAHYSTISGGDNNHVQHDANEAHIGGGSRNSIFPFATFGTIAGGNDNFIQNNAGFAAIGGGAGNRIETNADFAVIGGGYANTNAGQYAAVPGGRENRAGGNYSLAAGRRAKANHTGTFVWADSPSLNGADFASSGSNQFLVRATGGVGIGTTNPLARLTVAGTGPFNDLNAAALILDNTTATTGHRWEWHALNDGRVQLVDYTVGAGGSRLQIDTNGFVGIGITPTNKLHVGGGVSATIFITTSDRNAKQNFTTVDPKVILEKLIALPITRWTFKEAPGTPHLGPVAQDFYRAFALGGSEVGIATVDADGVALAAIQGLNQKLEERNERIISLEKSVAELKAAMESLKPH